MEDILFDLYYKSAHRNEELEQTIEELRGELKYRKNENKHLKSFLTIAENDYKKCYAENVRLAEENNQLKLRIKMLTKIGLNSVYGIHCCKNHCVYTDTDSIKEVENNANNKIY